MSFCHFDNNVIFTLSTLLSFLPYQTLSTVSLWPSSEASAHSCRSSVSWNFATNFEQAWSSAWRRSQKSDYHRVPDHPVSRGWFPKIGKDFNFLGFERASVDRFQNSRWINFAGTFHYCWVGVWRRSISSTCNWFAAIFARSKTV